MDKKNRADTFKLNSLSLDINQESFIVPTLTINCKKVIIKSIQLKKMRRDNSDIFRCLGSKGYMN